MRGRNPERDGQTWTGRKRAKGRSGEAGERDTGVGQKGGRDRLRSEPRRSRRHVQTEQALNGCRSGVRDPGPLPSSVFPTPQASRLLLLLLLLPLDTTTASTADACTYPDSPISSTFLQAISDLSDFMLRDYPVDIPDNLQVDEQCWALWHLALAKKTLESLKLVAGSKLQDPLEAVYTEVNFVSQCINQTPGGPADPHHSSELPALPTVSLPARALHCHHTPLTRQSWGTGKHPEATPALQLSSAVPGGAASPAAADPGGCLEVEAKKEAVEATRIP
ncbi:fms-related tyrosine kinase 3 ligand isoform X2 [Trichosurus vulpecula]|uniref:fms-related tyrosine kinase 3 ligand isoform X2 n=1 Tax=Trichosurus vulpecula TaxID=9337 RepID=UPI00186AC1B4|nr:fms-related tyrosine kinase 3 ligand isoform X2 [Trichosurus vulpecula]